MASVHSILIITSTPGFGDMIQQSLQETGRYKTWLASTAMEAISLAGNRPFSLAILDADLDGTSMRTVAQALKIAQKNLCLIVIPPDNNLQHPHMAQITYDGYLTKPFYLPDLLDTVAEALSKKIEQTPTMPTPGTRHAQEQTVKAYETPLEWLRDVSRAAQHLTRLSLESSAQAALIVRQGELWAYAGQLGQAAAQEVATAVVRFWMDSRLPGGGKSLRSVDMVRVVRLNTTGCDYMLYVTSLGREMVLALAFDAETPFSTIRSQASSLARSLASPTESRPLPKTGPTEIRSPEKSLPLSAADAYQETFDDEEMDEVEAELPPINLAPLLDNVPPPDPRGTTPRKQPSPPTDQQRKKLFPPAVRAVEVSVESSPSMRLDSSPQTSEAQPAIVAKAEQPDPVDQIMPVFILRDGQKAVPESSVVKEELRSLTPGLHGLYYVCLMIPRLPQHHLTGDLAAALSEMISQLCLAYGWRLEHITVRPDYLQWITSVPPTTSPSYLMRVLRQQTSQRIFETFPLLGKENPSGDFWAPGYLIMSGSQIPPAHIVKEFIQQTRHQQGATSPLHPKV